MRLTAPVVVLVAATRKNPIAFLALIVSVISLWWLFVTKAETWASSNIRDLIAKEARATLEGNAERAASLYCTDALVRNWGGYAPNDRHPLESWHGTQAILNRYKNLPPFTRLVHVDVNIVDICLFSGTARATSSTDGIIAGGKLGEAPIAVASVNGDIWEFRKVDQIPFLPWTGKWKIASFTYDYKK
jgi:hypothetical protein